ncbi:hypothetical protein D3C84_663170 [compost metagenome]
MLKQFAYLPFQHSTFDLEGKVLVFAQSQRKWNADQLRRHLKTAYGHLGIGMPHQA